MSRVAITRAVAVSSLGNSLAENWTGLLAGRSGIREISRFDCRNYISGLGGEIADLGAQPGCSRLDELRRRVFAQLGPVRPDCRLLVATTKGEIDLLHSCVAAGQPLAETLLVTPLLAKIAGELELESRGQNINAACASSTVAVARAAAMIEQGAAGQVLVFAADLLSEFVFSGFSALQALSPFLCRPFDRQRSGLNLGEAGVALLLCREDLLGETGEEALAWVRGWGAANDANHVTAPARDGCGLILACRQALKKAGLEPGQIAAVNGHGTATIYNDAMELTAFGETFSGSLPPLHGIKGSVGHCLGAAGALEVAVAVQALREQRIPGTVGCLDPEERCQTVISAQPQAISGDYLLTTNSGFGGVNGALVIERAGS